VSSIPPFGKMVSLVHEKANFACPRILDASSIHCPDFLSNSVFLAEDLFLSIFFPTQPAPLQTGVIPAVLPVKGLR